MNIGAEISTKIQLAITAKLKELDAFIDEELPDYIMIMVANKKTREQMTEALGLFLGDNTEVFTEWLHNLLDTLRKASDEYKNEEKMNEKAKLKQEKTSHLETNEIQKAKQESLSKNVDTLVIEPEGHDLLEDELFLHVDQEQSLQNKEVVEPKATQPSATKVNKEEINKENNEKKETKKKIEAITFTDDEKNSKSTKTKKKKREVKKTKELRKNLSNENESKKHLSKSDKKDAPTLREWDKGKNELTSYESRKKPHRRSKEYSPDEEKAPKVKRRSSVTSAVSVVKNSRSHTFVSDSESDTENGGSVVSKVAFPPRKPKLPADKQANRKLLLRAVVEAEQSVKKHTGKLESLQDKRKSPPVSLKRRREKRSEEIPTKERKRPSRTEEVPQIKDLRESKLNSRKNSDETRKRKHNVARVLDDASDMKIKRRLASRKKVLEEEDDSPEVYSAMKSDQRKFISKSDIEEADDANDSPATVRHAQTSILFDRRKAKVDEESTVTADPKFIVTLDGVSRQRKSTEAATESAMKKPFKFTPVVAPEPSVPRVATPPVVTPQQKPVVFDAGEEDDFHEEDPNDSEIQKMKRRLLSMERDAAKLKNLQKNAELSAATIQDPSTPTTFVSKEVSEKRSVLVSNVHFVSTEKQLAEHFSICGKILRVTILRDAYTGHPKGFAYIEFEDEDSAISSLALDNTQFNGRMIRVKVKQSKPTAPTPHVYIAQPRPAFTSQPTYRHPTPTFHPPTTRFAAPPRFASRNKVWVKPGYKPPSTVPAATL